MYSGIPLTKYSGRLIGAHQKIDRVARRHVGELLPPRSGFPLIRDILRFEGKNGPDGIKIKSPARNEPWHFLDPYAEDNSEFLSIIESHYKLLKKYLRSGNMERSSFEAAWLAHAIVDGLTPAHHYPYEEKLEQMSGKGKEHRTRIRDKIIQKGDTKTRTIKNIYKFFGPRGLIMGHALFEQGFAYIISPLRLPDARPKDKDMKEFEKHGPSEYFIRHAREIAERDIYNRYLSKGWTPILSSEVRHFLAPLMIKTVTVMWFNAAKEAGLCGSSAES